MTSEEGDLRNKGTHRISIICVSIDDILQGVEFLALVVGKCPLERFNIQSGMSYTT